MCLYVKFSQYVYSGHTRVSTWDIQDCLLGTYRSVYSGQSNTYIILYILLLYNYNAKNFCIFFNHCIFNFKKGKKKLR